MSATKFHIHTKQQAIFCLRHKMRGLSSDDGLLFCVPCNSETLWRRSLQVPLVTPSATVPTPGNAIFRHVYCNGYPIVTLTTVRSSEEALWIKHCFVSRTARPSPYAHWEPAAVAEELLRDLQQHWRCWHSLLIHNVSSLQVSTPSLWRGHFYSMAKNKSTKIKVRCQHQQLIRTAFVVCSRIENKMHFCKMQSSTLKPYVAGTTARCCGDWDLEASGRVMDAVHLPHPRRKYLDNQGQANERNWPVRICMSVLIS